VTIDSVTSFRRVYNAEPSTQYVVSVRAINRFGKGLVVYDLVYTRDAPRGLYISL